MATIGAGAASGARSRSIKNIQQVYRVVVQGGQQRLEIGIQGSEIGSVQVAVGTKLGRQGNLLAGFHQGGRQAIIEIQLRASAIGGDQHFTLLQGVTDTQFAQIALRITGPSLAGNGNDGCNRHGIPLCRMSAGRVRTDRPSEVKVMSQRYVTYRYTAIGP